MKFLASSITTVGPLAALAPIFFSSFVPVSALTVVPRTFSAHLNASTIPPECVPACQPALATESKCGTDPIDLPCLCTDTQGNSLAQCLDCAVSIAPNKTLAAQVRFAAALVLVGFEHDCADSKHPIASLSLSISPSATSSSGTAASGHDASSTGTVTQTQENTAVSFVYSTMPVIAVLQFFFISVGLLVTSRF